MMSLLLLLNANPSPSLPEIRLRLPAADEPPIVTVLLLEVTPLPVLPRSSVPLTSVPMKLPDTSWLPPLERLIPWLVKRLIARPEMLEPVLVNVRPVVETPALAPSSSILNTALVLPDCVLTEAPVWLWPSSTTVLAMVGSADVGRIDHQLCGQPG